MTVLETRPHLGGAATRGSVLPRYTLVGGTGAPIVVVLGGISATRHVVFGETPAQGGWWSRVAGEGLAIDITRHRVLGVDFMDGGRDASGRPRRTVTTHDQATWLARILRTIGEDRVHAVVGSSYGGMVALAFAELFPALLDRLVVISAPHESHPMSTALRTLQRRTVELGLETGRVADAMSIARGLAMTTYRTAGEFAGRFSTVPLSRQRNDARFEVDAYLRDRGARFADSMRPERFLALSLSSDLHRVDATRIRTPTTLVAAEGDVIVPREQLHTLATRLRGPVVLRDLPTRVGHDAFLVETAKVSSIISSALG
ncbi:MAG TPA: homoserine O-succinyltransferase [Gemmatimonadaceae bacterium]|nr:homoserine O-succinyltransferase [Gemmatimonadaceae bacterium]